VTASFELDGAIHQLIPLRRPGGVDIVIDGKRHVVETRDLGPAERIVTVDGRPFRLFFARSGDTLHVHYAGRAVAVRRVDAEAGAAAGGHASDEVLAPMPGIVIRVDVRPGDEVARGDVLLAIESMKLQTAVTAPRGGKVARVAVAEGGTFDKGAVLVVLAPLEPVES
jgi:3-methylcrotonyl-CoA carboxylase alpha subunit